MSLHHDDLVPQLLQLQLECLILRLSLLHLDSELLIRPRQRLHLVLCSHIHFGHLLRQELDLEILLIELILKKAFLIRVKLLAR